MYAAERSLTHSFCLQLFSFYFKGYPNIYLLLLKANKWELNHPYTKLRTSTKP